MIEFKDVSIKYHSSFYSLIDCNIKIKQSSLIIGDELFTSAFCRILMNLDKYNGEILIDNELNKKIKTKNYQIAYVPKTDVFFENKTAIDNIIYPLKIRNFNKKYIENAKKSLKNTYNYDFFDKKVKFLSSDERKLVAILRATIHTPKYILIESLFDVISPNSEYYNTALSIVNEHHIVIITSSKELDSLSHFDQIKL